MNTLESKVMVNVVQIHVVLKLKLQVLKVIALNVMALLKMENVSHVIYTRKLIIELVNAGINHAFQIRN